MSGISYAVLGWLCLPSLLSAARIDSRHSNQIEAGTAADSENTGYRCPKWLCADLLGFLFDVKMYHKFPDESDVMEKLMNIEERILKISGESILRVPATGGDTVSLGMLFSEMDDDAGEDDLAEEYEANGGDLKLAIDKFLEPHRDTCANTSFASRPAAATTPSQIYENIKAVVDTFDIFTMCTKSYVKRIVNGQRQIQKDDVIAISTELAKGVFARSFEDISQYHEYVDQEGIRHLIVIVTSRKENVIEGNYDIVVSQYPDHVHLQYTKRQNLAEPILRRGITNHGYAIVTRHSVDKTIRKLSYAGLYGAAAIELDGCMEQTSCVEYEQKEINEKCKYSMQCKTRSCPRAGIGRTRRCAANGK